MVEEGKRGRSRSGDLAHPKAVFPRPGQCPKCRTAAAGTGGTKGLRVGSVSVAGAGETVSLWDRKEVLGFLER